MEFTMRAVGRVQGGRSEAIDDQWAPSRARIALDPKQFDETALAGLADFSHAEIVYVFDRVTDDEIVKGALDIKPYLSGFAPRGAVREPEWAKEIMKEYW